MRTDPVPLLTMFGGWARTWELLHHGVSRRSLTDAVKEGAILRVREGWYISPDAPPGVAQAIAHGGIPGCFSAAASFGIWVPPHEGGVHVWMNPGHHARKHEECRCVSHWDLPRVEGARSTAVEHCVLQIAQCAGDEAFFVCLESALNQALIGPIGLRWLRDMLPRSQRPVFDLAGESADSGIESIFRYRCHLLGIRMRSQVGIPTVGVVDFVIGDRLIVEIDGRENHDGPSARHKDLVRDAHAAAAGYETLRFDYALIMHDWAIVEAAVTAKIASGAAELRQGVEFASASQRS